MRVLDDGLGIDPAEADPGCSGCCSRVHADIRPCTPGAGTGLFVCRQLVEAMGGRIWAESRPEGGSEFGFTLGIYDTDEA